MADFDNEHDDEFDDRDFYDEGPSKSAVKREMHALQEIGTRLTELSDAMLAKVPLEDDRLIEAITLARKINTHSAKRRQLQYIGKLMRSIDPEPIQAALDAMDNKRRDAAAKFHLLEQLRDDLLKEGDTAIQAIVDRFPNADRSHLRQLVRQHKKSQSANKPDNTGKKVFRYLKELEEAED